MIYEYNNNILSKEEIGIMLKEAKTPIKNIKNLAYYSGTSALIIFLLISFMHYDYRWDNRNLILIGAYLFGTTMVLFKKKVNLGKTEEKENVRKKMKQSIEFKDGIYRYRNEKFVALLDKNTISEIIKFKEYTLIFILPKRLKSIIYIPLFIPNNIFESEEKYNEFINAII